MSALNYPPEAIELYLTSGIADAVLERRDGWTLLHECAKQGIVTPVIIKALRHHIDRSDMDGKTPVFYLTEVYGTPKTVELFALHTVHLERLRLELKAGWTLLHQCVEEEIVTPTRIRILRHHVNMANKGPSIHT